MKTSKIFIFTLAMAASSLQSCNYTDLEPTDMVGKDKAFENIPAVSSAINGAYSLMSLEATLNLSEYIADDVKQGGQAGGAGTDSYTWTYTASAGDHSSYWDAQYRIINMANRIIEGSSTVTTNTEQEKKQLNDYLGNAYFLRAYVHFDLLRFFSDFKNDEKLGIPYVTHSHVLGQPERDKVGDCYKYLTQDLDKAFNLLANDKPTNVSYASRTAVNALRARVALYHKQYLHAYVYATEALRNTSLASAKDYSLIWADKSNEGVILKLPRAAGQTKIGGLFYGGDHSHVFGPSQKFMSCYDDNDIRKDIFFGKGPDREGNEVDIIKKYIGTSDNIGLNDEKLLRADEMKLIEIECLIYQDRITEANSELNKFRAIRIKNWSNLSFGKDELINQLLIERRRELAFEGHRFFDLRRYGRDIVRDNANETLFADHFRQLLPIPQSEIESNTNIANQQNPGY